MSRLAFVIGILCLIPAQGVYAQKIKNKSAEMKIEKLRGDNPFFRKSTLQYQSPEFDKIKIEHYRPAFDLGLKIQEKEIEDIANNPKKPTVQNTLEALEKSGEILRRAQSVFYNLTSSDSNEALQTLESEYAPIFAAQKDKILLNEKLYQRLKSIDPKNLEAESRRLLEVYLQNFKISGAELSQKKKEELKKLNRELAVLQTEFSKKLLAATKTGGLLISDVKALDGLSQNEIAGLAFNAKQADKEGKYLINLQNTTQQPELQKLKNRVIREKLFMASWKRAEKKDANDTRNTIERLAILRLKKAKILGFKNYAEWNLQDQMAKTPKAAVHLMKQIAQPALEKAKKEQNEIEKLKKIQGDMSEVAPWDWNFYAEQVRKGKYDLNEEELKPYFEIKSVLEKGVFYAAEKFYGLTFKRRNDLPVYHPDVVVYEVFDSNGKSLAIYFLDFYIRDSKRGGAWMSNFVEQSTLLGTHPVIVNCFNYQKPAEGKPSLINFREVETIFHEFGHSLHGFFSNQKYPTLSGTNVPRDFVEFPSQINEHFALEEEILKNYARHYKTNEVIPAKLIEKIKKSSKFNQGYQTTELVSAAMTDMAWHTVTDQSQITPVSDFEKKVLKNNGFTLNAVPPRYHTPYFAHIWGGGYAAGYYAYLWSETLDSDAWDWIKSHGGITRENGDRFRRYILSVGNSVDLNETYKNFAGRNPNIKPLLRDRGFIQ
ncbi:MAG: M3 family metallopeptidase [Bergeyella sp.]|nr:M3 family metallopeptidase [Bergeyella sp.]